MRLLSKSMGGVPAEDEAIRGASIIFFMAASREWLCPAIRSTQKLPFLRPLLELSGESQ